MDFAGRHVVLVGAASGIGRETALLFAARGADLSLGDVQAQGLHETAELVRRAGGTVAEYACDVTSLEATDLLMSAADSRGDVDVVVSTVGWSQSSLFAEEDPDYWQRVLSINLVGAINVCRSAVQVMAPRGRGAIVLTSSDAGKVGTVGVSVYAAAKAGVIGLVKSVAREVAADGIRVNAVAPGPTDTALLRRENDPELLGRMIRAVPMKRLATMQEQAAPIVFLASDDAGFVTGQTLSVSGGLTMSS